MNNIINCYKFNKLLLENDKKAIDFFYSITDNSYFIKPIGKKYTEDLSFIYFKKSEIKVEYCSLCICKLNYDNKFKVMPIYFNNKYFLLSFSNKQYVLNHLVVASLEHKKQTIDLITIKDFLEFTNLMPSFVICANTDLKNCGASIKNHLHYQIGLIKAPLFLADATEIEENLYQVNWYLKTFLIKTKDKDILLSLAEKLFNEYKSEYYSFNPIMYKRSDSYYLYLICRSNKDEYIAKEYEWFKKGIGVFEAMGIFILDDNNLSIFKQKEIAKEILEINNVK